MNLPDCPWAVRCIHACCRRLFYNRPARTRPHRGWRRPPRWFQPSGRLQTSGRPLAQCNGVFGVTFHRNTVSPRSQFRSGKSVWSDARCAVRVRCMCCLVQGNSQSRQADLFTLILRHVIIIMEALTGAPTQSPVLWLRWRRKLRP